ncbi:hypothetical protein RND71_004177 [Anisodus tanguticus]|uniref:Uncharacterized protein n=1 Tax=Anisodus tanguticus TaxID=243964 RepID=A0AAE1SY51_9SOLA|nr:hypothetical protein RND71_004177 [Anisodus tanguticus]
MTCGFSKKMLTTLAFLSLLLMGLLHFKAPFCGANIGNNGKFYRFKGDDSSSIKRAVESHNKGSFFSRGKNNIPNMDEMFGDDKRKVRTGPNPLHNR